MNGCTLLLVRHAHTRDNGGSSTPRLVGRYDSPLSSLGEKQVERLRGALAGEAAEAAYASPLRRAMATARALPERLHPLPLGSLQEIYCGRFDGWLLSDVQQQHPDLWKRNLAQDDDSFRWPGGETYARFRARVLRTVRALAGRHCGGRVVAVTHAGFISQLLGCLAGARPSRWEQFRPGNASITEVRWGAGEKASVVRYDDRRHLEDLAGE
ncbi:MAG TPA: histidine phosphatase family protein [Bryobacteraceae bacterium]|nr:histidine phosphatase family protein [Bryobacteraceae bacterium]